MPTVWEIHKIEPNKFDPRPDDDKEKMYMLELRIQGNARFSTRFGELRERLESLATQWELEHVEQLVAKTFESKLTDGTEAFNQLLNQTQSDTGSG